jgi:3-oxoacyl-[acyl-carrier protein] reductase
VNALLHLLVGKVDRVIDINLRGVFVATQAALKHLKAGGRIITIDSCVVSY